MTRPAIVIGLGGTGRWVLTYLKKDFLEANNGTLPAHVRLLAYDTDAQPIVGDRSELAGGLQYTSMAYGPISLQPNDEYHHLGSDLYQFVLAIREGQYPSITKWFDPDALLTALPRASFVMSRGAGQIRQLGRLALLQDLTRDQRSVLRSSLTNALLRLRREINGREPLQILVTASLAGGTGSGMFIDIALLVREICVEQSIPNMIVGYLVLPGAFKPFKRNQAQLSGLLINSLAAWREANRFMMPDLDVLRVTPTDQLGWQPDIARRETQRVFDICYLVDGVSDSGLEHTDPTQTIFPSIANAIDVMIDDHSGRHYSDWVASSLASGYAARAGEPLYSAFGTFAYKSPSRYYQTQFAYQLCLAVLDRLLSPVRDDPKQPTRITRLSSTSLGDPLAPDHSALRLLSSTQSYEDVIQRTTPFTENLSTILEQGGRHNRNLVELEAVAGSRQSRTTYSQLMSFTQFEGQAVMGSLEREIGRVLGRRILDEVATSKALKERPELGLRRILRSAEQWMMEQIGAVTVAGSHSAGAVDLVLEKSGQAQLEIFQRLIRLWLQATLMGSSEVDPLQARSGRIGYAFDLVNALLTHFISFREFMTEIIKRRHDLQITRKTTHFWKDAEASMRNQASKRSILGPHPQAYASQTQFLEAIQTMVDAYTTDRLHQAVLKTAEAMRSYCVTVRDELAAWIEILATGAPHRHIASSVYDQLRDDILRIEASKHAEQSIPVQTLLQIDEPAPQSEDITHFLSAVNWKVQENQERLLLSLELVQSEESVLLLHRAASARPDDVLEVKRKLLQCAQSRLTSTSENITVLDNLVHSFPDPGSLVEELSRRTKPFVDLERFAFAAPAKTATMFCVTQTERTRHEPEGAYVNAVENQLRARQGSFRADPDRLVRVWNFSDPCKAILLNTLELLPVDGFRSWSESMQAYSDPGSQSPFAHHIFPAEVNATRYESRAIATRGGGYRFFHPRVVALLNDLELVRQFIVAWASGWITLKVGDGLTKVEFDSPTEPHQTFALAHVRNVLPNPFDVIVSFGQAVEFLSLQHPQLTQILSPSATEISAQLLQRLQMEREGSGRDQSLLVWLGKYREFVDVRKGITNRGEASATTQPEAYSDLMQLVELLLEEFLGARARFSPLDFDTLRFFQAASWTVTERTSGYMVCSPPITHSSGYNQPICVRTFFGSSTVDGPAVQRLYETARLEFDGKTHNRVIMAVTDDPPAASAYGHIYSYRAGEGLAVVVLPSSVLRKALTTNTTSMELDLQLRRALGNDNLYIASNPIKDFLTFFGRASLIEDMLQTINRGEHIGIFGLRKMGKTSLMWQLKERIKQHGVVHVDLQGVSDVTDFLYPKVIRDLVQDVLIKYPGIKIPDLELARGRSPYGSEVSQQMLATAELIGAFERDLQAVAEILRRQSPDSRIVLFFDEAERTLPWEGSPGFVGWDQFWGLLRGIAQRWNFLTLVIASVDARINRTDRLRGVDNPMYKFLARTVFLPPLSEQEDNDMIVSIGKQMGLQWEKSAQETVHRASGGHPFISREICSLAAMAEPKSSAITNDTVVEAVDTWLSDPACMVEQIWSDRLSEGEQQVLVSLTQAQPIGTRDLIKHVSHIRAADLRQAVASLKERHIITMDRTQHRYFITFGVLSRWIEENILDLGGVADD